MHCNLQEKLLFDDKSDELLSVLGRSYPCVAVGAAQCSEAEGDESVEWGLELIQGRKKISILYTYAHTSTHGHLESETHFLLPKEQLFSIKYPEISPTPAHTFVCTQERML